MRYKQGAFVSAEIWGEILWDFLNVYPSFLLFQAHTIKFDEGKKRKMKRQWMEAAK